MTKTEVEKYLARLEELKEHLGAIRQTEGKVAARQYEYRQAKAAKKAENQKKKKNRPNRR